MQILMVIFFAAFTEYDENTDPATDVHHATGGEELSSRYSMWQDVHIMIFIGFGFLMTFLRSYGFSSLTLNFLVGVFAIQWGILCVGFFASLWEAGGVVSDSYGTHATPRITWLHGTSCRGGVPNILPPLGLIAKQFCFICQSSDTRASLFSMPVPGLGDEQGAAPHAPARGGRLRRRCRPHLPR